MWNILGSYLIWFTLMIIMSPYKEDENAETLQNFLYLSWHQRHLSSLSFSSFVLSYLLLSLYYSYFYFIITYRVNYYSKSRYSITKNLGTTHIIVAVTKLHSTVWFCCGGETWSLVTSAIIVVVLTTYVDE